MLKVDSLSKSFKTNLVLDSVSIDFSNGRIILLVGENGSGKTTAFKMLLGLIKPDCGTIDYDSASYSGLIEEPAFNNSLTGQQNIDILLENYDTSYFTSLLNDLNIYEAINKKVGTYSLGMRQKLGLAYLFLKKSDYLLLDEPVNSLDKKSIKIVLNEIMKRKEAGLTTIIISHQVNWIIDYVDEVYKIEDKKIKVQNTDVIKLNKYVFVFSNEDDAKKASELIMGRVEKNKVFCDIENSVISDTIKKLSSFDLIEAKKEEGDY